MTKRPKHGALDCERREFLRVAFTGVLAIVPTFQQSDSLAAPGGKVWDPARAGRSMAPITAADNDAAIQAIEKGLRCSCGCGLDIYTCRTTDFNCTYSPALHRQVVAMAAEGRTAQEIIDAFVAEHGVEVLMAPPKRGFNLAGYFVPSLAVLVAGAFLIRALRRWTRLAAAEPAVAAAAVEASPAELERLRRELERLPS